MTHIINFIIFFCCFFLMVGLLTVIERKILGIIQGRRGPNRMALFFGAYHFILDSIKVFFKGSFVFCGNSGGRPVFLVFSFCFFLFLGIVFFFVLPFNFFGINFGFSFFFLILVDVLLVIGKIILMKSFCFSRVVLVSWGRYKNALIIVEGIFVFVFFLYICIFFKFGIFNFYESYGFFSGLVFFCFFPMFTILFLLTLFKLSRAPFDFFESESEFVGGGTNELFGFSFGLWSLVEYLLILNNGFLLFWFGFCIFFKGGFFCFIIFFFFFLISLVVSRGVFIRINFNKTVCLLIGVCLFLFIYLLLTVLFLFFFIVFF